MAYITTPSVVRQIETLFDGGAVTGLSDRQLLERFTTRRDAAAEAAFAALVRRHGSMVLGVCRQLLGDRHHAEDAFQAVFLVLARKARSLQDPDRLGHWIYGVALRTARKAKVRLARQRRHEEDDTMTGPDAPVLVEPMAPPADQPILDREQAEILHGEIERLPGAFRLPVVLCYFEGLTLDEAARRLRWPAGTVRSRLARARDKLRRGLNHRGVVLPAAALASALSPRSTSASLSSPLCEITTRAAMKFAAGQAAGGGVSALAQAVLRSMIIDKLRWTLLTLLALATGATGVGYLTHSLAMKDEPKRTGAGQQLRLAAQADSSVGEQPGPAAKRENAAPGRMTVTGRVLDPAGKPVSRVPVEVIGRPRAPRVATDEIGAAQVLLGRGSTDSDGRFRLDASRTSSVHFLQVYILAAAPGCGLGWAEPNPDAEQPAAEIRLRPDQVIQGKLVDLSGQPATGVEIRVGSLTRDDWLGASPPDGLRTWPRPAKTNDQGRFTFAGIGRDTTVFLNVRDPRFAHQSLKARTDDRDGPIELMLALQPATIVEGRALAADTGRPIPRAIVSVGSSLHWLFSGSGRHFRADDQGRFTAHVLPGQYYSIRAYPPEGQPYLIPEQRFEWTKGAVKTVMDIKLPRGVLLRGKVIEEGSGRPLARASVQYSANPHRDDIVNDSQAIVASQDDGSFQIAVPPGKGHLLVFGPTSDYILEEIGWQELWSGRPGGWRTYAHDIIAYEVKDGEPPPAITAALRPGKTVKGRVVGPQNQSVGDAVILTRLYIEDWHTTWRGVQQLHARDGFFELHGLNPERSAPVYFLDADHQWGATVELSGNQSGAEVTVRLQPCGQAKARVVGPDGQPVAGFALGSHFEILATPGPPNLTRRKEDQPKLLADAGDMVNVDPKHYLNLPPTNTEGRITLPGLIPGALYRVCDQSTMDVPEKGVQVRKDFTIKPGETLELGDILIEKP
jgi:RNA polymerase sigma factor (sigma-70 family)